MISSKLFELRAAAAAAVVAMGIAVSGQQPAPSAIYTADQATAGRAAYQASCAGCHRPDLAGANEAPELAGANFRSTWRDRTTRDLLNYMTTAMPPDNPGSAGNAAYTNILASFRPMARPRSQPLTPATAVPIGTLARAQAAAATAAQGAGQAPPRAAQAAGDQETPAQAPAVRRGLTVSGEVKNYVPVTDEMLRNPDPGDWLMVRRNYQAWSYSPLNQITRDNVQGLKLAWVWAMNEGAWNEPTPLVHNGIVYLANTGNMVQAIDGRTGELIWENRLDIGQGGGGTATRNIAIYQDKIFIATTDARLVALDARNGKAVWETRIADRAKGYQESSGPTVINGKVVQGLGGCDRFFGGGRLLHQRYDAATGANRCSTRFAPQD